MGFDQTLWIIVITGGCALVATIFCLLLGRRAKRATQLSAALLLLAVGTFAYGISTVSPSPHTLFTEEFGTPPDATITDLKAVRLGGAGTYHTYIQFHAPPATIARLLPGKLVPEQRLVSHWQPSELPNGWVTPSSQGYSLSGTSGNSRREWDRTGHFGIRLWPDTCDLRYHPKENLVQCFWGFYE